MRQLRILIPGGTGKLGTLLARHYHECGHLVSTITRFPRPNDWEAIHWDAENLGPWVAALEGADAVINLAGRPMNCRYTQANRHSILQSRLRTTGLVGQAIGQCANPPGVWLNASTAAIYPAAFDHDMDEGSGELGDAGNFRSMATQAWEAAVLAAPTPRTRKVLLRSAAIMTPYAGGTFDKLLRLVRWGLGGEAGDGEQYVSWIHDFDFVRAVDFLIGRQDLDGAVNIAAPAPLANHQFMCNLRRAWCTSYFGLPAPEWLVNAAALVLRTEPELVLRSQRVVPRRLLDAGFSFTFPKWRGACENLVERWRRLSEHRA
jgi:uncharacterized protein (TIGR01777 family)